MGGGFNGRRINGILAVIKPIKSPTITKASIFPLAINTVMLKKTKNIIPQKTTSNI
jgi:hypothetical protein